MKYTKGPWVYFYSGSGGHDIIGPNGEEIATCRSGWAISEGDQFEIAAANARFIKAAPDMLKTLEAITCMHAFEGNALETTEKMIRLAAETIRKAKGIS